MKHLLTLLALTLAVSARAGDFENTVCRMVDDEGYFAGQMRLSDDSPTHR